MYISLFQNIIKKKKKREEKGENLHADQHDDTLVFDQLNTNQFTFNLITQLYLMPFVLTSINAKIGSIFIDLLMYKPFVTNAF